MASVDPYSPCPCGSGQKFKWCCHKVESYAECAQRMVENGQYEAAIKPLAEGLAKYPDNPWLLTRKALIEVHLKQFDAAKESLRVLLKKEPGHLGGTILMTRLLMESEGATAAIAQFQQGLSAMAPERRGELAPLASLLGISLCRSGFPIAGFKHLELVQKWGGPSDDSSRAGDRLIEGEPRALRLGQEPVSPLAGAGGRGRPVPRIVRARHRLGRGGTLGIRRVGVRAAGRRVRPPGAIADRNRGICCLWIADIDGAVESLRRFIARTGPSVEAVDLEAICQRVGPPRSGDRVEFVHLSWPIRNRAGLLDALRADPTFEQGPDRPLHPDDPDSTATERFYMLDRKKIEAKPGLTPRDIPVVEGEVIVGKDAVYLETYDDGRLDRLSDRFTAAAGANIPPAHPRTKVIDKESRHQLAMSWRWSMPQGVPEEDVERLNREQMVHVIRDVWPETPQPALRRRTRSRPPRPGATRRSFRASIRLLETSSEDSADLIDWDQLRAGPEARAGRRGRGPGSRSAPHVAMVDDPLRGAGR